MEMSSKLELSMTFKEMESSDAVKEFVSKKANKLVKHMDNLMHCRFVFSNKKTMAICHLHVSSGDFEAAAEAEADGNNLYAAIDTVIDRMDQQIKKFKAKHRHE